MPHSLAGQNLEVNLSTGEVTKTEYDPQSIQMYLGGRGIATQIFWDRVPPQTAPFSPDNLLIFSSGALTGTIAPGANRTAVITRSPQTHLLNYSLLGGYWGAELKHAGYDTLIISGKSSTPVYVCITDAKIEIRDAGRFWGTDVNTTKSRICQELGQNKVEIACIGLGGENRVNTATIQHGYGSGVSRGGVGAVMGHKNLKAIVVYGTRDITLAKPPEFVALCHRILEKTGRIKKYWDEWPYEVGKWLLGDGVSGNLEKIIPFENISQFLENYMSKFKTRTATCLNCGIGCKSIIKLPDGSYTHIKCQSYFNFMLACKIRDLTFGLRCYQLCESYGLDVISMAGIVAFAIDIYQKGILTKSDTDGMHLEWGNAEVAFALITKIARRDGIGEILSHGVYEAARLMGKGASDHAYHLKKLEPLPYHTNKPVSALRSAIADKPDMTRAEDYVAAEGLALSKEWKEEYLRSGFFSYPPEFEKIFQDDAVELAKDYEKMVPFVSYDVDKNALADCTGLCIFWTGFWPYNPITVDDHVNLVRYALGLDLDQAAAMEIAKRTAALTRAYNVILGIRRKDDTVSEKYFHGSADPPFQGLDRDKFRHTLSDYYNLRRWNQEGIPSGEELERLKLHFVKKDLQQRGIL